MQRYRTDHRSKVKESSRRWHSRSFWKYRLHQVRWPSLRTHSAVRTSMKHTHTQLREDGQGSALLRKSWCYHKQWCTHTYTHTNSNVRTHTHTHREGVTEASALCLSACSAAWHGFICWSTHAHVHMPTHTPHIYSLTTHLSVMAATHNTQWDSVLQQIHTLLLEL